jgi:hypothetical protein
MHEIVTERLSNQQITLHCASTAVIHIKYYDYQ